MFRALFLCFYILTSIFTIRFIQQLLYYSSWKTGYTVAHFNMWSSNNKKISNVDFLFKNNHGQHVSHESNILLKPYFASSQSTKLPNTSHYLDNWNRLLKGFETYRCYPIPINMSLCQNVGYDQMLLPNYLQHEDLKEAVDQSQIWMSLIQTDCHSDLRKFLCALYAPVCIPGHHEKFIYPCQNLCNEVRKSCLPKMLQFGFDWPDIVKCDRFPVSNLRMCIPLVQKRREEKN